MAEPGEEKQEATAAEADEEARFRDRSLPPGLYLVGTPIGNLEDISLRALRVLRTVDRIACEDTRTSAKLLHAFGISKPLVSLHTHNEGERSGELLAALLAGSRVAVVTDAGMPGISDPGMWLARQAIEHGVAVFAIPGPNAAVAALVASGLPTERFLFCGFLPEKPGARRTELERLRALGGQAGTVVLYEAPHRVVEMLRDVEATWGGAARVAVGRELTKLHEEWLRGTAAEVGQELAARDRVRGELVVLLDATTAGAPGGAAAQGGIGEAVGALLRAGVEEKEAVKRVARERSLGRSEVYREWQRVRGRV